MNKMIRETYTCKITTITPVHIGSGNVFRENIDYIADRNTGRVTGLNIRKIFQVVEKMGSESMLSFAAACEKGDIYDWLRKAKLKLQDFATFQTTLNIGEIPKEIREHQRNGFGVPYLPGSSLKGAFRTAIISKLANREENLQLLSLAGSNLKFADQNITKKLLGDDPNHNLMRCVSIGDACFNTATPKIVLAKVASMKKPNGFNYKPFTVAVECIKENESAELQMSIDTYLLEEKQSRCLKFTNKLTFDFIKEAVNELTRKIIEHEQKFCKQKLKHDELRFFYENVLSNMLNELKQNEVIMNLGWGIGWEGMTGGLLKEDLLTQEIRKKLNLAPHRWDFPFPKTRKIAQVDNKITPWGWIKIAFEQYDRGKGMPETRAEKSDIAELNKIEPKSFSSGQPTMPERPVEKFIKQIQVLKPTNAGTIASVIDNALATLESDDEKKEFALAVKAHMVDLFKKSKVIKERLKPYLG